VPADANAAADGAARDEQGGSAEVGVMKNWGGKKLIFKKLTLGSFFLITAAKAAAFWERFSKAAGPSPPGPRAGQVSPAGGPERWRFAFALPVFLESQSFGHTL